MVKVFKSFILALVIAVLPFLASAQDCGCMDLVFVIDDTGSMSGAISNVKSGLADILSNAQTASGGDLFTGLVSFKDHVIVKQDMTDDPVAITNAILALVASGGGAFPEASDQAINLVVNGASDSATLCATGSLDAFLTNRLDCLKIAILVTDATPGGCDNTESNVLATEVADDAAGKDILISAIQIGSNLEVTTIMQNYATVTGGVYIQTSDGSGTASAIDEIIAECGTAGTPCSAGFFSGTGNEPCEPCGEDLFTFGQEGATACSSVEDECLCEFAVNHGDYVSCVAALANTMAAAGELANNQKGALVQVAARGPCGMPV